jgi:hypothetical protein
MNKPIGAMKDGKATCPGCGLEFPLPDIDGKWVKVDTRCSDCGVEFTAHDRILAEED